MTDPNQVQTRDHLLLLAEGGRAWAQAWARCPFGFRLKAYLLGSRALLRRVASAEETALALGFQAAYRPLTPVLIATLVVWGTIGVPGFREVHGIGDLVSNVVMLLALFTGWFLGPLLFRRFSRELTARLCAEGLSVLETFLREEHTDG